MRRAVWLGVVGLMVAMLPACGGGSPSAPSTPAPTPTPAPVSQVIYSVSGTIEGAAQGMIKVGQIDVNVPGAGTINVLFDWTAPSHDVDVVVTRTDCNDYIGAYNATCFVYGADLSPTRKPATATFAMTSGGTIRIWLYIFSNTTESGVLNVTWTH